MFYFVLLFLYFNLNNDNYKWFQLTEIRKVLFYILFLFQVMFVLCKVLLLLYYSCCCDFSFNFT